MSLKDLNLKLRVFKIRRLLLGNRRRKRRIQKENGKIISWAMPISHGYYVVETASSWGWGEKTESDSVIVQREEDQQHREVWLFGIFNARVGESVSRYMQAHFFDKRFQESQMRKKSKEIMRKAHQSAITRTKTRGKDESEEEIGSASAMVINGEKLVIVNMGDYKAAVCRNGEAYQICRKKHNSSTRHWFSKLFPGASCLPRVCTVSSDSSRLMEKEDSRNHELAVRSEWINSDTEFVILASPGVWETMKHQEAVNLVRHIEDPQKAAECLANEAVARLSKGNISCLIIRFD